MSVDSFCTYVQGLRVTPYKTLKLFCVSISVTAVLLVPAFDVIGFLSCHNEWNVIIAILINVPQHMLQLSLAAAARVS
jgi:hypothetical protein